MSDGTIRRSPWERLAAWALTGPPGRLWSFGRDLASATPMLLRYWGGKIRGTADRLRH